MTPSPLNSGHQKESLLKEGLALFEAQQWAQSFEVFSRLLKLEPLHFEALHRSALVLLRQQKFAQAVPYLVSALSVEPHHLQSLRNLSWVLFNLSRYEEAKEIAKQRLAQDPDSADGLSLWAQIQTRLGQFDEALRVWLLLAQKEPQLADIQNNLGVVCHQKGDFNSAISHYSRAQALAPKDAKIAFNIGVSLERLERWADAILHYQVAIELDHQYQDAFFNLGVLFTHQARFNEALECFDRVLSLNPNFALAFMNKAVALQKLKDLKSAQVALERAMVLDPTNALIHFNLATVLQDQRQLQASAQLYRKALELDYKLVNAWCNLGDVCHDLQDPRSAIACYEEALRLEPQSVRAKFHLSLSCLLDGQFEKAWPLFEFRREYENSYLSLQAQRHMPLRPLWTGQVPIKGKRIWVMCEQGLGDTLQFVRYLTPLAEMGAQIVLQAPEPLLPLLKEIPGVFKLLGSNESMTEEDLNACDFHVPLLSLPLAMGSKWRAPLDQVPYLRASPEVREKWRERLGVKTHPRVGLVWSGGLRVEQPWTWAVNQRRNIELRAFEAFNLHGLEFFSVQKGERACEELKDLVAQGWRGPAMINWMDEISDFEETAALVEQLDLLISVDTSTAHLAGALGKPVWLLNRYDTCWRWQTKRADSPWYPSMKIYRQSELDDWSGVVDQVRADLVSYFSLDSKTLG